MTAAVDGALPTDIYGRPAEGVYVPNKGTVGQLGGTLNTDTGGQPYAPSVAQIGDQLNPAILASVKAANTPPTEADQALVSVLGPNNTGLPVNVPAIVQQGHGVSSADTQTIAKAFTNNNIGGNSIIVVCGAGNNGTLTVTDSAGNTYTSAAVQANSTTFEAQIFYAVNIAAGANTVTVTNAGTAASMAIQIYEVSGLLALVTAQPAQSSTATGTGTTASTSALSAAVPNGLAFLGVAVGTTAEAITAVTGTPWTADSSQNSGGTPTGLLSFGSLSLFIPGITPVIPQATIAASKPWAAAAAIFRSVALPVQGSVHIAGYNFTNITTKTTTVCKTGPGTLKRIIINAPGSTDTLTIYDNTAASGTKIGTITVTASVNYTFEFDAAFSTGLTIVSGGGTAGDYTAIWR